MKHSKMELIIGANNKNLNDIDRNKIIARTLNIYLKKEKRKEKKKKN